ncbi:MAG: type II toxin-antitoxin system RelE/ParE family toxin [Pyrinomonadaceae bacterium]
MIGYRYLPPAEEEMSEASLFYEAASTGLGNSFLDDVQRVVDRLREHPYLGRVVDRDLRKILLHRFPFSLIYSAETDAILIVAVAHYGRRPGYWRDRVE